MSTSSLPPTPAPSPVRLEHRCAVCGAPALFGFGVRLLADRPGTWSCGQHRADVERMRSA